MPTDLVMVIARKAGAKHNSEGDLMIASVWLVLYLFMLVGMLTEPLLARAVEVAALH